MLEAKKFYIQYQPYVTFTQGEKVFTRKLHNDNKQQQTGEIIFNNEIIPVHYHY